MKIFGIRITRHAPHAHVHGVKGRKAKADRPHAVARSVMTALGGHPDAPSKAKSEAALRQFQSDPQKFLMKNQVTTFKSSEQRNDIAYSLVPVTNEHGQQVRDKPSGLLSWRMQPTSGVLNDKAAISATTTAAHHGVNAMQQMTGSNELGEDIDGDHRGNQPDRLKIDTTTDNRLILTTQISGCTATFFKDGEGNYWVTHIQPRGKSGDIAPNTEPTARQREEHGQRNQREQELMREIGIPSNATASAAYQNTKDAGDPNSYDSDLVRATVIGVTKNGKVQFYVQERYESGEVLVRPIMQLPE